MGSVNDYTFPNSSSPDLRLDHPTAAENALIWNLTASVWQEALPTKEEYLRECSYLTTVPLAKNGGMTQWILVDKNLPPGQRAILASCETFRKRSWVITDGSEEVREVITHAFANVYCDPKYRGRGYAPRMMRELAEALQNWQTDTETKCVASVLFSDIGKTYYSRMGWRAFPSFHIDFDPSVDTLSTATPILAEDVGQLCQDDEILSRNIMRAAASRDKKTRFMIMPGHDHMLWHHSKDEFTAEALFQKKPTIKGAIVGEPGNRIWVIWTHRFYEPPGKSTKNVLYILRLAVENQTSLDNVTVEMTGQMKRVIAAAQTEAANWNLHCVRFWDPSPQMEEVIKQTGIPYNFEEREEEGICSLMWYGEGGGMEREVEWLGKEVYGWC